MERFPEDSYYLQCMKTILDAYPQHSPPLHPTKLTDQLYIGNQDNADDVTLLTGLEITHVLNCAGTRTFDLRRSPYPPGSGIKGFLMIPAYDFDDFDIMRYFEDAIGFLDNATRKGGTALVHCSIGVNRSGAISAAYLMVSQKKRLMDVIVELKAKRLLILCNMGFRKQLVQFARSKGLLDRVEINGSQIPVLPQREAITPKDAGRDVESDAIQEGKSLNGETSDVDERKDESTSEPTSDEAHNQEAEHTDQPQTTKAGDLSVRKYIYKTRGVVPEIKTPAITVSGSSRSFQNVDPNIVVKVINESYNKYKQSNRTNDLRTPLEINATLAASGIPQHQRFIKKSAEKELAREVEEFLSHKTTSGKNSEVSSLLDRLISKEDERLIWGKGSMEDDPKFVLFRENLERSYPPSQAPPSVPQITQPTFKGSRPLEMVKKYQETTNKEIFKNLQDLVDTSSKKSFGVKTPIVDLLKLRGATSNHDLDNEVNEYLKKEGAYSNILPALEQTIQSRMSTREPADEVLKRISTGRTSSNIKPISFYRLQVLTENKQSKP